MTVEQVNIILNKTSQFFPADKSQNIKKIVLHYKFSDLVCLNM